MSMNAMSFESRLTIMTTDVGSVILTPCASRPTASAAQGGGDDDAADDDACDDGVNMVPTPDSLERRLQAHARQEVPELVATLGVSSTCVRWNDSRSLSVRWKL